MARARIICFLLLILATILLALPGSATPPRVNNTSESLYAPETWLCEKLWQAGHDDDEMIFGAIAGAAMDADGRIYILDSQLALVNVFTTDGELLHTLSRAGDGPGECRNPVDMCLLHPDMLGLAQPYPGRVITMDYDGVPTGDIHFTRGDETSGPIIVLQLIRATENLLVLGGFHTESDKSKKKASSSQELFLIRCTPEGRELGRYMEFKQTVNFGGVELNEADYEMPWNRVALAADGHLYFAPERNAYTIQVFSPDGRLQLEICREYKCLPRTREQLTTARNGLETWARYTKTPLRNVEVFPVEPDITAIWPRSNGELWVRTSRGDRSASETGLLVLDVFDAAGHYHRQVELRCPCNPDHDLLYPLQQDHLLVVHGGREASLDLKGNSRPNDGDRTLAVRCYRLSKTAP